MRNIRQLVVVLVFSMVLLACSGGSPESEAGSAGSGGYPPMDSALLDTYLQENAGKPTFILFWTTWCPSCKQAMPEMDKLFVNDGDRVNVIAVSLDESAAALDAYFQKNTLNMPVYHGDQSLASRFGIQAIPTLVFFDKQGKERFARPGAFPYDMLKATAEKLLAE